MYHLPRNQKQVWCVVSGHKQDTTSDKVVVLDTDETARKDLVTIADGLPVTGETDRNNFAVTVAVNQGLEESAYNNELIDDSTEATAIMPSTELKQTANSEVAQPASSSTNSQNNTRKYSQLNYDFQNIKQTKVLSCFWSCD